MSVVAIIRNVDGDIVNVAKVSPALLPLLTDVREAHDLSVEEMTLDDASDIIAMLLEEDEEVIS